SIGVARARETLSGAALVLWVVDGATPLGDEDRRIAAELAGARVVVALNKCDRPRATAGAEVAALLNGAAGPVVEVSATLGRGLGALREALARSLGADGTAESAGVVLGNLRHIEAVERARAALARAAAAAADRLPGEIVALELREALATLGE